MMFASWSNNSAIPSGSVFACDSHSPRLRHGAKFFDPVGVIGENLKLVESSPIGWIESGRYFEN